MTSIRLRPPDGPLDATVTVPGSKSVANRALVCAALADGASTLTGLPSGDDTSVVIDTLHQVGRVVLRDSHTVEVHGSPDLVLPGIVDARLAGTSSRFLTAVAALSGTTTVIDGDEPLRGRPMKDLHDALRNMGVDVTPLGEAGHLPVSVSGGGFTGRVVAVRGDVSSQFISALMLIAPLLPEGLTLEVDGHLVSRSYVEMTASVMRAFGAKVHLKADSIEIEAGGYRATDYHVEPDYSSAAFPLCAVVLRHGRVRIPGLAASRLQGDSAILDILSHMGVKVETSGDDVVALRDRDIQPTSIDRDMSDCSDLVPAVAVSALAAHGITVMSGIGFIRNKESDRIDDLAAEIAKTGGAATGLPDGLQVEGGAALRSAVIAAHDDHRMVMAMSLISLLSGEIIIDDVEAVSKSWPTFFGDMAQILGPPESAK